MLIIRLIQGGSNTNKNRWYDNRDRKLYEKCETFKLDHRDQIDTTGYGLSKKTSHACWPKYFEKIPSALRIWSSIIKEIHSESQSVIFI